MTPSAAASSADGPSDPKATVEDLRRWARGRLRDADDGAVEAREATTLIALALGWTEAQVFARGERVPSGPERRRLTELVERRRKGEPFAYLAGRREFFGRDFFVDSRVLIPRPETEHLIEACLALEPAPRRILDVGTGSGCIALTLALEMPSTTVLACDISLGALAVAQRNLEALAREDGSLRRRVHLFASDLMAATGCPSQPIDTLVSNPPYIGDHEHLPRTVVAYEPHVALFSGPRGTETYRRILTAAESQPGTSRVIFELGAEQAPSVVALARDSGFQSDGSRRDLAGWERVLMLRRSESALSHHPTKPHDPVSRPLPE